MSRPKPYTKITSKSKGKGKAVTDFTSIQSALSTSSNDNIESWLQEGVAQEEQGERYQFGPKASRHFTNAVICYKCALTIQSTSFDALYNLARTNFSLGSEHLSAPDCYLAIKDSISSFRQALLILEKEGSSSSSNELIIDTNFNLAQSLVVLQNLFDEGAIIRGIGERRVEDSFEPAWEAKEIFKLVENLQRIEMVKVFDVTEGGGGEGEEDEEDAEEEEGMDMNEETNSGGEGIQGSIVTPNQIIDTLTEAFENDLYLYSLELEYNNTLELPLSLSNRISESLDSITQLRSHISSSSTSKESDLQLSLLKLSYSSTCNLHIPTSSSYHLSSTDLINQYLTLIQQIPNHPNILSSYADYLFTQISSSNSIQITTETLKTYELVYTILQDKFSPHRSNNPIHSIPILLSTNLTVRGKLYSILSQVKNDDHSKKAKECFSSAIEMSGIGYKLTSNGVLTKTTTAGRLDWATVNALREAFFSLLRILLSEEEENFTTLLGSYNLITGRNTKLDLEWFIKDIEGDTIWELKGGKEVLIWQSLLNSL